VKRFIFRYISVPASDGVKEYFLIISEKDISNKFIELNKSLNNICIFRVKRGEASPKALQDL